MHGMHAFVPACMLNLGIGKGDFDSNPGISVNLSMQRLPSLGWQVWLMSGCTIGVHEDIASSPGFLWAGGGEPGTH